MKRFWKIISDSFTIMGKDHLSLWQRLQLLAVYKKIVMLRFMQGRIVNFDNKAVSILGFKINVVSFGDFYWTFYEVFVKEDYAFTTNQPRAFMIDAGGNLGVTTLYFKWRLPQARVIIFEPQPETAALLEKTITDNKLSDVTLVKKAVADREGEITIFGNHRAATISQDLYTEEQDGRGEGASVISTVKLSQYITEPVEYLKIDIEGAEGGVIQELGESNTLDRVQEIAIEYHTGMRDDSDLEDLLDTLRSSHFVISSDVDLAVPLRQQPKHFMIYGKR